MAYEQGMLEMALAAAVGNDPTLVLELRSAFLDSAEQHYASLAAAAGTFEWQLGALRLKGLAASFGADDLIAAVDRLAESATGNVAALSAVRAELDAIAA